MIVKDKGEKEQDYAGETLGHDSDLMCHQGRRAGRRLTTQHCESLSMELQHQNHPQSPCWGRNGQSSTLTGLCDVFRAAEEAALDQQILWVAASEGCQLIVLLTEEGEGI